MAVPFARTSFSCGEIAPSLFGHVDFAKFPLGCGTLRNMFVSYRGGANSRAGTKFIGYSRQVGRAVPPRLIPFQFSVSQGIVLEFGNYYMRPIINGGYAVDVALPIAAATKANPCQITINQAVALSATLDSGSNVTASYAPGDTITLAGGTYTTPAVFGVTNTQLNTVTSNGGGSGYNIGDTITPVGGTQTVSPLLTVTGTQVWSATINNPGTGGASGAVTLIGTTGTGVKFTATGTISSGHLTGAITVTAGGGYTVNPTTGYYASAATVNAAGVTASYAPGDTYNLVGGTLSGNTGAAATQVKITSTTVSALPVTAAGTYYAPGDQIELASSGGGSTTTAVVTVASTQVVSATVNNAGSGGPTSGSATVRGTTGLGTLFQAVVTFNGSGQISGVTSVSVSGNYTTNPTGTANSDHSIVEKVVNVSGAPGLTGASLNVVMGVNSISVTMGGTFTSGPANPTMTQASTSGYGTGVTFGTVVMAPSAASINVVGSYASVPTNPAAGTPASGSGAGCTYSVSWLGPNSNVGAEPVQATIGGSGLTGATLSLTMGVLNVALTNPGVFIQNPTTLTQGWTSGAGTGATFTPSVMAPATLSVITPGAYTYTALPSNPASQASTSGGGSGAKLDITWASPTSLYTGEWIQLSGVGGMTQLNGKTAVLTKTGATTFTLTDVFNNNWDSTSWGAFTSGGTASRLYTLPTPYAETDLEYIKFAESADVMSLCCWNQSTGTSYPTYDLTRVANNHWTLTAPTFQASILPPTNLVGNASASGTTQFVYQVTAVSSTDSSESVGSNIAQVSSAVDITSTSGTITLTWTAVSGASAYNIYRAAPGYNASVPAGAPLGYIGVTTGTTFIDSNIVPDFTQVAPTHSNPLAANNPGLVAYYQSRRFYASSPSNPDTYWASKPGAYYNFDSRIPTVADDALSGNPWSVQVNGLQWMLQEQSGLVVLTGQSAWILSGTGSSATVAAPLTPSSQQATPQEYNGCSATLPPIKIRQDILYVQPSNAVVSDLAYNFWVGILTGSDITVLSNHLLNGYTLREWCYAEEPWKVLWAVRNDGVLLSLTWLKSQEVAGWARHDTQGAVQSVCSVIESPINALYMAVQRYTASSPNTHMIERMDNRVWANAESAWCVDAGLTVALPTPAATLYVSSPTGLGAISGITGLVGGTGYSSSARVNIVDNNGAGPGTGAVASLTIVSGVITNVSFSNGGTGYVNPQLVVYDPAGTGAGFSANCTLGNAVTLTTTGSVFSPGNVGNVVRAAGGMCVITGYTSGTQVPANMLSPMTATVPNAVSPYLAPIPAGSWTMATPVTTVSGLDHLNGLYVTGLADGNVIPLTLVVNGTITLSQPATLITVGLGFRAQLQTTYMDIGQPTIQAQRKKISAVSVRMEASRGLKAGCNQPDGSTLSPIQIDAGWANLVTVPDLAQPAYNAVCQPLYTGDARVILPGGYQKPGQVCVQQDNPLPMNILAVVPELDAGDMPQPPGPAGDQRQKRG